MNRFGLQASEIASLIEQVRPVPGAPARGTHDTIGADAVTDAAEAFALASWTVIAEPADESAVALIAAIGATAALEAMIAERSPAELAALVNEVAGPATITEDRLRAGIARWRPRLSSRSAVRALEQAARFACRLVLPGDPDWPIGLADLDRRAPHALWASGSSAVITAPVEEPVSADTPGPRQDLVAIVGARAATGYGEHVATEFAAGLVDRGAVVVSGGAYGIDGAAHRGALANGGRTVAVLAGGLDRLYPAGHDALLRRVADTGLLLAEVPCGTPPTRYRFLQRNRLIAAISDSVVIVEAGARSGSLNTAGHAAEIGRPIGVVPGPITSAASAGCHRLLREFPATCVTNVSEVLELHRSGESDAEPGFDRPSLEALRVIDALSARLGRDSGELARLSGLAENEVRAVLGQLELAGTAGRGEGGWVRR